jgi:hypothetical protein
MFFPVGIGRDEGFHYIVFYILFLCVAVGVEFAQEFNVEDLDISGGVGVEVVDFVGEEGQFGMVGV